MKNLYKSMALSLLFLPLLIKAQTKEVVTDSIQPWYLRGNSNTNPSVNFLGTTDANRLVIRTNDSERATILPNGYFGIGTPNPTRSLFIKNANINNNAEIVLKQSAGATLGSYVTFDNTANPGGKYWSIGSTGSKNFPGVVGSLEFYQYGFGTRMIIDSLGRVGIGVIKPTAQLHTTGSVRFAGLTQNTAANKVLAIDNSGNVYYTNSTSLGLTTGWSLTGNSGTVPGTNFLGTTDANRLVIKTNNTEQATVLPNGYVGFGTSSPTRSLYIQNANITNNAELVLKQSAGATLGSYITFDNTANPGGKYWSIGSTGSTNSPGVVGSLEFYQYGFGTRMIIDSTGKIGIGVIKPTAQLHTTGSVRFAGITQDTAVKKILGIDNSGNVYYTSIPTTTIIDTTTNGWSLTGNAGTSPGTNFLGTTDAQRLVIKTNNVEHLTVLPSGYVGLNNSAPDKLFTTQGNNSADNAEIHIQQMAGSTLGAYLTLDNTANGGKWWSIGSTGTTNSPGVAGALEFYQYGVGTKAIFDQSGNFGIALGSNILPSATLHVNGTVRFQNIPSGSGNTLVVDGNGNVFRSSTVNSATSDETSSRVGDLENEINDLKQQIIELKSLVKACNPNVKLNDEPALFQNVPNPASSATVIKLYIPDNRTGNVVITDMLGNVRKTVSSLQSGNQQVTIDNTELGNGTYIYSLYVDGRLFQSKKMIVAN